MKPDWKDAPNEALFLAQDDDGNWHWFEDRPVYVRASGEWYADFGMMKCPAYPRGIDTLERRP